MDRATILALNQINRDFYTHRAEEFSATRRRPWRGWLRLLPYIGERETLSVLDVGCGNGRFAVFLSEHLESPFSYLGIEFSATALEHARAKLSGLPSITLKEHDVMAGLGDISGPFSLIALFGFLHHVPGFDTRRSLLIELGLLLEPDGILAFSVWQFGRFERFRKKLIPWDTFLANTGVEVDRSRLEPGDHILSWGGYRAGVLLLPFPRQRRDLAPGVFPAARVFRGLFGGWANERSQSVLPFEAPRLAS